MNNADLVWRLVELLLQKEKLNATTHLVFLESPMNNLLLLN